MARQRRVPLGMSPTHPSQASTLGGRVACNACDVAVVLRLDDGNWGRRFLLAETVPPLGHLSHITLRHGAMVLTDATVGVTHSFGMVYQANMASVVGF